MGSEILRFFRLRNETRAFDFPVRSAGIYQVWERNSLHQPHCSISNESGRNCSVEKKEFSKIRRQLGKTQSQTAELLGVSLKAIQSFEQGWRDIPVHIERQLLFLLAMKRPSGGQSKPCWAIERCPVETRQKCPAWEFQCGHLCWFINGTICRGEPQESWRVKMEKCRECEVLRSILSNL